MNTPNVYIVDGRDSPLFKEAQRRHNRLPGRACDSCQQGIVTVHQMKRLKQDTDGALYWRVLRRDGRVEFFHDNCFEEEFEWHSSSQTRSSA